METYWFFLGIAIVSAVTAVVAVLLFRWFNDML